MSEVVAGEVCLKSRVAATDDGRMASVQVTMIDKLVPDKRVIEAFAGITVAASGMGYKVEKPDASTMVVVRRYCPTWAIIVGILLFPLGLLLIFFYKVDDRLTITGADADSGGARYTVLGRTDKMFAEILSEFLVPVDDPVAPAPTPVPTPA